MIFLCNFLNLIHEVKTIVSFIKQNVLICIFRPTNTIKLKKLSYKVSLVITRKQDDYTQIPI